MSEKKTVAGAYDRIAEHELECAKRYGELDKTVTETKGAVKAVQDKTDSIDRGIRTLMKGFAGLVVTVILGMAGIIWASVQSDIADAREGAYERRAEQG
ncbi:hypothetical protein IWC96_14360 [Brevundimonas sp. BAL450]|uniref:hypothetical protein n=1 Tax=Brevundimonas sp. BAL450 TaxID=1708162 RepID=UPI0018CA08B6|nr:hypothetical protein [Brevundimonas sp. BAL450]MBG7616457.1 hypothetical protein [Brevundimonas sp. BAL450]